MSKADTLLKKTAFYEKLALYSDRSVFLQALAQQSYMSSTFGPDIKRQLESVISDLSVLGISDPNIINTLSEARDSYTPTNRYLLIAALTQAAAKFPKTPEHVGQLQNLQDLIAKLKSFGATSGDDGTPSTVGTPAATTSAPGASAQYASIPTETQDHLNQILLPYGKIAVPLKLDGKLGPKTQEAIRAFKQTYNKPATPKAIREVYLQVAHPELVTKTPF